MRYLIPFFLLWISGFAQGQGTTGLRKLDHDEIVDLTSNATLLFARKGEIVQEYHSFFFDDVAVTAFRNWHGQVVEGRLELITDTPGLVCYRYSGSQENCAFFIMDEVTNRLYLEFVDTVQQQTVEVVPGDRLDLMARIQIPYE